MLVSSILYTTILTTLASAHFIGPSHSYARRGELQHCTNSISTFSKGLGDWVLEGSSSDKNYEITPEGLTMKILKPVEGYKPEEDKNALDENGRPLRYNKYEGSGFTFNATTYMQYGKFTASVRSAKVPGAITAVILIADNGDEIDFELLAGGTDTITTNYFWGQKIEYGVNGRTTDPAGNATCDKYYSYSIDWSPERIIWSLDGNEIRRESREDSNGKYPTGAARVQIGLWDGSGVSGTAQWAHGPINWNEQGDSIGAYVKDVKIECDPAYNHITNS